MRAMKVRCDCSTRIWSADGLRERGVCQDIRLLLVKTLLYSAGGPFPLGRGARKAAKSASATSVVRSGNTPPPPTILTTCEAEPRHTPPQSGERVRPTEA